MVDVFQDPLSNDKKRKQIELGKLLARCSDRVQAFLGYTKGARAESIPARQPSDINVLYSMACCMPQRRHADYSPYSVMDLLDDRVCHGLPLGVIIALQDNTAFDAWPGAVGHELERFYESSQLTLGAGDALFFLGNAIHAGAGFQDDNVRIHAYLDSNALRESDTTHFADVAAGVVGALPRDVRVAQRIDGVD
jgi:hypothetical protein